jgi:hypothetical protein
MEVLARMAAMNPAGAPRRRELKETFAEKWDGQQERRDRVAGLARQRRRGAGRVFQPAGGLTLN